MSILIKIIGTGFLTCLINPILKKHSPQTAAAVTIAASVVIFSAVLRFITEAVFKIKGMSGLFNIDFSYAETIVKSITVSWVCEYCGAIIEDAGEKAIAKKIEFAGKIIIFIMIFPLLTNLCENILSLIR